MTLGFKKQFVPSVASGRKPHSIRADKRWRAGMSIQFYENMRQPTMRKFRPDGVAEVVQTIEFDFLDRDERLRLVRVDGRYILPSEAEELAVRDGFADLTEMFGWFREAHGLPFAGKLIIWQPGLRY